MDKISVIIPAYNVEPYVGKCIDSVINQTYEHLEIILIDDGSTDISGRICDEYAERDNRIRVFHKDNGGVSSARNVGLMNHTGKYVGFVDSDDWIEPDMYEVLHNALTSNCVSVSAVSYRIAKDSVSEVVIPNERIPCRVLNQDEMLLYAFRSVNYFGFQFCVFNKLFSSSIIKNNKISFDEDMTIGEDAVFTIQFILTDNCTGFFVDNHLYNYFQRESSLMHNAELDVLNLHVYRRLIDLTDKSGYNDASIWVKREHCYRASLLAEKALRDGDVKSLLHMQGEMGVYYEEYIEINKEYTERIDRVNMLFNAKIQ